MQQHIEFSSNNSERRDQCERANGAGQVGGERDHGFDRARYEQVLQEIRRYRGYLRIATQPVDGEEDYAAADSGREDDTAAQKVSFAR